MGTAFKESNEFKIFYSSLEIESFAEQMITAFGSTYTNVSGHFQWLNIDRK